MKIRALTDIAARKEAALWLLRGPKLGPEARLDTAARAVSDHGLERGGGEWRLRARTEERQQ